MFRLMYMKSFNYCHHDNCGNINCTFMLYVASSFIIQIQHLYIICKVKSYGPFTEKGMSYFIFLLSSGSSRWDVGYPLWRPASCCPVKDCNTYIAYKYRRHWQEKHETLVPRYKCLTCLQCYTRQSSLIRHIKEKHEGDVESQMSDVEYIQNVRFVDPSPLTLKIILGHT